MEFEGKVVLVTGASRGIGKAIALAFADKGASVVVNYHRSQKQASDVVSQIENMGSRAIAVQCDVSDEDAVETMVSAAIEEFGRLDVLVNSAGIVYDVPLFEKTEKQWDETLAVNLKGVFLCSKACAPHLQEQDSACIINIASNNGLQLSFPESADYDASKAGVISLTKALAEQLAPLVRVNAIAPGWIDTDMNADLPEEMIQEEIDKTFLQRMGQPSEIASVAVFLCSPAASFMTASVVTVDGGYK